MKVQQIVLKVARKDLDAQVEQKAKDLIAKLRGANGQATEAAFAEAARGNSEDPATARERWFSASAVQEESEQTSRTLRSNRRYASREMFLISRFGTAATGTSCVAVMSFRRLLKKRSRSCWFRCATVAVTARHFNLRRKRKRV